MKKRTKVPATTLGAALGDLIGSLGIGPKLRQYDAVNRWEEIVGTAIAQHAAAERISQGILVVRVASGVWRHELTMRKQEIIGKLNTALGEQIVRDIKFQ